MGTNYYARVNACKECGHSNDEVHIGKSSAGWNFALHVTPALKTLGDWEEYLLHEGVRIFDEYGGDCSTAHMLSVITDREPPLLQNPVDGDHCVGHSEGTYDCVAGEFC